MRSVETAAIAEFLKLQPLRRGLFIFRRRVVATLARRALQHYVIARHNFYFLSLFRT